ncbi:hypothetical protein LCGC14_3011020 [marine sediment metagenome]|uniref:N-acetyltransferase domain-containing protein n=1 Tax=marine sediment metagenome TaxID=412755 RepID=A0A0F8Z5S2_9ZZZZ
MILRDFKISDLDEYPQFRDMDKDVQDVVRGSLRNYIERAYTLEHDGRLICSAGFIMLFPGVANGYAWGYFSDLIHKYPIATHKIMIKMIDTAEKKYGLKRLQVDCVKGFGRAIKWLEHLGFEYEGEMRRYGPNGETMLRFGRVS